MTPQCLRTLVEADFTDGTLVEYVLDCGLQRRALGITGRAYADGCLRILAGPTELQVREGRVRSVREEDGVFYVRLPGDFKDALAPKGVPIPNRAYPEN